MLKMFELLRRRDGVDHDACLAGLTQAAAALAGAPGVPGYTVQEALPLPARKDIVQLEIPADVDAFVEIWCQDEAAYAALLASPAGQSWRQGRAAVVGAAKTLVIEERAIMPVPAARPPARNNAFLTRHARFADKQAFLDEWLVGHGDMCLAVPYLRGFVPCVVQGELPQQDVAELAMAQVEGIAQAYFDTPEEEMLMIQTPQAKAWFAHGATTFGLIKAFGARETAAKIPEQVA
ncbi:hypothetical protein [Novosphingobium rosa]|uniref:hypothetical protein n=1 Tax=Novosphingobium rosa TaxID=76978 RepID=UPI00082F088B|nr:hypothetical protein [Novosphingobium rosa]